MNRAAVLVFIAFLVSGCADQNTLALYNCEVEVIVGDCVEEGSKANPTPKLHKQGNRWKMTPSALCTEPGAEVKVAITPVNQFPEGSVIIAAKDLKSAVWLIGSNSPDANEIKISIPGSVTTNKYSYVVVDTTDGTCLDPRWDVD